MLTAVTKHGGNAVIGYSFQPRHAAQPQSRNEYPVTAFPLTKNTSVATTQTQCNLEQSSMTGQCNSHVFISNPLASGLNVEHPALFPGTKGRHRRRPGRSVTRLEAVAEEQPERDDGHDVSQLVWVDGVLS